MKYMGLFFQSKKPTSSVTPSAKGTASSTGRFDRNSKGRITPQEFKLIGERLKREMSHSDAEQILQGLVPNMDSDGRYGGRNISAKEANDSLDYMEKGHHSGLSNSNIKKVRDILSEYQ